MACVTPETPRLADNEERRDDSALERRTPISPKLPDVVLEPLPEVRPVGVGSAGRDIVGSGNAEAIALASEARALESTETLDAK